MRLNLNELQNLHFFADCASRAYLKQSRNPSQGMSYYNSRLTDTQAFLWQTNEYTVVSFRGTQEPKDWKTNFDWQQSALNSNHRIKIHHGFYNAMRSVCFPNDTDSVYRKPSIFDDLNRLDRRGLPVYFTGHSLGGALATLAAYFYNKYNRSTNIAGIYTFGSPQCGNSFFARDYNTSLAGLTTRVVHGYDRVPKLPLDIIESSPILDWAHVGGTVVKIPSPAQQNYVSWLGSFFALAPDHSMNEYIASIEREIRAAEAGYQFRPR